MSHSMHQLKRTDSYALNFSVIGIPVVRKQRMTEHTGLLLALVILLFLWEGFHFGDSACFILLVLELACVYPILAVLPLRRISFRHALYIYAAFLFFSASAAYVDYEVMLAHGMWFADRLQDDPGKYFWMAQVSFNTVSINDPGFVILLQNIWKILTLCGEPSYLTLLNSVIILSSIFAVCCVEIIYYISPSDHKLPYFFVFNPLIIMMNAYLMRDILIGAIGWSAVLCGIAFLTHERGSIVHNFWLLAVFIGGSLAVYFMRSVSGIFFIVVAIIIAVTSGNRLKTTKAIVIVIFILMVGSVVIHSLLQRSMSYVQTSESIVETAKSSGSVASLYLGSLAGRIAITIGTTAVYLMPFWRISSPLQVDGILLNCGSLFAQLMTAFPFLMGLAFLLKRLSFLGCALLVIYLGWCVASAAMLQGNLRYITSHLLPILAAIGLRGWDFLKTLTLGRRRLYYYLVIVAFLTIQILIEIRKACGTI